MKLDPDGLAQIKRNLERDLAEGGGADWWPPAQVKELVNEIDRLRDLLARLEWAGAACTGDEPACPACGELQHGEYTWRTGYPGGHHDPHCWLAEELTGGER